MELMDVTKENKLIYQHNVITSGRYDYSKCMLDILFMVLSCLETDKLVYNLHAKDIEAITGRKWNLQQLRETTEIFGSRMFEIKYVDEMKKNKLRQLWLFEYVEYTEGEASFEVKINDSAKPYFFELKNNFTSMQLKSVLNCSSKYAKRLYAIACQWRSVGTKRFEIKELKEMLGLIDKKGNEEYTEITAFKKRVLDIACTQISENTDLELEYELKKRGRSFHWITLNIDTQKFKQLEIDFNKSVDSQKYEADLIAYGFNKEQAEQIAQNVSRLDFEKTITDINLKVSQKKLSIKNAVAYLVGVYQKKGILK